MKQQASAFWMAMKAMPGSWFWSLLMSMPRIPGCDATCFGYGCYRGKGYPGWPQSGSARQAVAGAGVEAYDTVGTG